MAFLQPNERQVRLTGCYCHRCSFFHPKQGDSSGSAKQHSRLAKKWTLSRSSIFEAVNRKVIQATGDNAIISTFYGSFYLFQTRWQVAWSRPFIICTSLLHLVIFECPVLLSFPLWTHIFMINFALSQQHQPRNHLKTRWNIQNTKR